jgi:uncharacterized protein YjbJ (UPF0337 family)
MVPILQLNHECKTIKEDIMLNEDTIKGKWNEIKGEIRTQWGKMSDDELEKSSGNLTSIAGLIQQRYGAKKEEVQEKLNNILAKFSKKSEEVKNRMQNENSSKQ